jgi:N utilization substance protein B
MIDPRHQARRCAVQALYTFDATGGPASAEALRVLLLPDDAATAPTDEEESAQREAMQMALAAWSMREQADRAVAELAPQWPTYRQPVVDRCILRLAYWELATGRTPPKVVINESVELAREFSTDKSPLFVNGVLDKLMRALRPDEAADAGPGGAIDVPPVSEP